jgi:hypothetical protein
MRGCPIPRCPTAQLDCLIEPQLRNPGPPRLGVLSLRPSVSPAEPCSRLIRAPTLRAAGVRGRGILRKYLFFYQLGEPLVHRWLAFSQQRCVHRLGVMFKKIVVTISAVAFVMLAVALAPGVPTVLATVRATTAIDEARLNRFADQSCAAFESWFLDPTCRQTHVKKVARTKHQLDHN